MLLGIALGDSAEDALARPIASFFPDREDLGSGPDAVKLHHVLTMTTGLAWNETLVPYNSDRNDLFQLGATDDPVGFVLIKELRDTPGNYWNYNSGLTDITAGVIEKLTGKPLTDCADEVLFGPLGITDYGRSRCSLEIMTIAAALSTSGFWAVSSGQFADPCRNGSADAVTY